MGSWHLSAPNEGFLGEELVSGEVNLLASGKPVPVVGTDELTVPVDSGSKDVPPSQSFRTRPSYRTGA